MPTIHTTLTRLLGIQHPILLAPMGSASGGKLAAAVTRAGGFGMIGSAYGDKHMIQREFSAAGNAPIGIGFITWRIASHLETFSAALAHSPRAVMLSFGDPLPYYESIRAAGAKIICQVQSLEQARQAIAANVDILVAQGRDAGGHSGTVRGTMALLPAVVDAAGNIPVVAAGGIADGRGLAAALALGAAGVLMGSRFAASRESLWSDAMKQGAVATGGDDTEQTRVFDIVRNAGWPAQFPGRVAKNQFLKTWRGRIEELEREWPNHLGAFEAAAADDLDSRPLWIGESADLIREVLPAGEIVSTIISEAIAVLRAGAAMIV